jgi:hypothetical protein
VPKVGTAEAEAGVYLLKRRLRALWAAHAKQGLARVLRHGCADAARGVFYTEFRGLLRRGGITAVRARALLWPGMRSQLSALLYAGPDAGRPAANAIPGSMPRVRPSRRRTTVDITGALSWMYVLMPLYCRGDSVAADLTHELTRAYSLPKHPSGTHTPCLPRCSNSAPARSS